MTKDTIRTFIAVELPNIIQENLANLIEKLKNKQDKITWAKPHNIHLTLKFLGNIRVSDLNQIKNALSKTTEETKAFNILIKGTGVFPKEKSPRVIWTGISDNEDNLKNMSADLENKLSELGFQKEERNFKSHLTLGRVKYLKNVNDFINNLYKYNENIIGKLEVNSISLIKSTLTPKGSIYETIYNAKLKKE